MIHFIYKSFFLLLFVPLWNGDGDFTKNYHKEYDVPPDATVELINKYGYTKVHAWDKHIVSIDVNILANTASQDRAQEIFDKIQINFTSTNTYIKAETVINNPSKSWWDWKNWLGVGNSNNSSYKINYDVYMPTDQYLKLSHKYGDAYIDRMDRDADVKVSYGHLRLEGVNADLDLDLAYSDGNIGDIKNGKINLRYSDISMSRMLDGTLNFKYSDIKMKEGGDIKAECAYGDLEAERIKTIDIHSRYDDIVIKSVENIYANGAYSDFDIGSIKRQSTFTTSYGDIIIRDLSPDFRSLDLKSTYTDIRVNAGGNDYRLDADGTHADIKTTGNFTSTYMVEKSSSTTVRGYTKSDNTGGRISASLSYGGLRIE